MSEKEFDIIISNPPYGKVGSEITHNIIDNIDYKEFVNLLPANDYHRRKDDLYKYADIDNMVSIKNGFKDATVTTHLTKINKKPSKITEAEFEINNYIDRSLDKYFFENINRKNIFINIYLPSREVVKSTAIASSAIFGKRDVSSCHLPYSKKVNSYKWNVEESIAAQYLIDNSAVDFNNAVSIELLLFNTKEEKKNFVKFIYSKNGFKFISKLFTAINCDARYDLTKLFPKVDWTHEWTVEEILVDYGYTESEIKEVMDDLVNFKDMER